MPYIEAESNTLLTTYNIKIVGTFLSIVLRHKIKLHKVSTRGAEHSLEGQQ